TSFASYVCVKDGFVGLAWKYGDIATGVRFSGIFAVARFVDATGAETGGGFTVFRRGSGSGTPYSSNAVNAEAVHYTSGVLAAPNSAYGIGVMNVASTLVGADTQVYKCFTVTPRAVAITQLAICATAEYSIGTTFSTALVGS